MLARCSPCRSRCGEDCSGPVGRRQSEFMCDNRCTGCRCEGRPGCKLHMATAATSSVPGSLRYRPSAATWWSVAAWGSQLGVGWVGERPLVQHAPLSKTRIIFSSLPLSSPPLLSSEADPNQLPPRLNWATTDEHRRMVQKWHQVDSYNRSEQRHQRIRTEQGFAEDTSSNQPWRAETTTKHQNNPGAAPKWLLSSFDLVHEPTGPECQEWVPLLRIPTSRHSSPLQLPTKADHSGGDQPVGEPDRSGPVP